MPLDVTESRLSFQESVSGLKVFASVEKINAGEGSLPDPCLCGSLMNRLKGFGDRWLNYV